MSGIAGIISNHQPYTAQHRLQKALQALKCGTAEKELIASEAGEAAVLGQVHPAGEMESSASAPHLQYFNRYCLVLDGTLYNVKELRQVLKDKGFPSVLASQEEVLVAAYAAWGTGCLHKLEGAFAFAIWDAQEQQLWAARDRMGEKPLYYFYDGQQLAFASAIKAFWSMDIPKEVNRFLLYNFLAIDYTGNPADPQETFFENIHQLPAASFLTYSPSKQNPEIERYWQLYPEVDHYITEAAAIEQFTHLLQSSVAQQGHSQAPLGLCLSGGLDSSSIAAFCRRLPGMPQPLPCFTAIFPGFEKDEGPYAQTMASHLQLQPYLADISAADIVSLMQQVMAQQDEPFISASPLAQYKVYEAAAASGVRVLLDGQGADEILAGYHQYYPWYWMELFRQKKLHKSQELEAARKLGVTSGFSITSRLAALFPELAAGLQQSRKARQAYRHPHFNRDFAFLCKRSLYYSTPARFDLNGALYFSTFVNGLQHLLRLADRNSRATGVEVRLPFLNHHLVTFLFTVPPHLKIRCGWTKWLLRKSVDAALPASIVWRKDKTGFEPPQKAWMQQKNVVEAIQNAKEVLVREGVLDTSVLQQKIQPHAAHVAENKTWKYWSAAYLFDK